MPVRQFVLSVPKGPRPFLHLPARGPPQTELAMELSGGKQEEVAQEGSPDDLNQSLEFDPADPGPVPHDHFDQSWGA